MFRKIVLFVAFSAVILSAQTSATYGNLIRIPFDAVQIDPADTMGSWFNSNNSISEYEDVIHTSQKTYFEKLNFQDYEFEELTLEDFINGTSDTYGAWFTYFDIPESYILFDTYPYFIENGTWLINGVYNTAFLSNDDTITIIPKEFVHDLVYVCGKINDKFLVVYKKENPVPSYDFYLADLSNSPDIDTTTAEKIYFDRNVAPYKLKHLFDSLYIVAVDSLPFNYNYSLQIYNLQGNTFHYQSNVEFEQFNVEEWEYKNELLFIYARHQLFRYQLNKTDTTFEFSSTTLLVSNEVSIDHNFSNIAYIIFNDLYIYNYDTEQLINIIDISKLRNPHHIIIDSPYVYIHQTTYTTDVKDKPIKPLSYDLQIYPNPFNPSANIEYTIPERAVIHIKLFDVLGREVREIFAGENTAGTHQIKIDGTDLSSGIYFVNFISDNYMVTKKIVLLK